MIRLTVPSIDEIDLEAVVEAISSGYLVQGPRVEKFERLLAEYVGVKHAVAVSNCTCALHLALLALDVRPGDLCIVTSYSWVSTANVIELCGAQPVFVDIDPLTFNIDLNELEVVLNRLMATGETARRVKAVLPVHTFGQMAQMEELNQLCSKWDLPVVEDAACALGSVRNERQAGAWGKVGCFSFHPRKAITTGEGGMLTTNDDSLAGRLRALRNHGLNSTSTVQDFIMPGHNYRMTEFQAALGCSQMGKLQRIISSRSRAAKVYDKLLSKNPLRVPHVQSGGTHVYQSYVTLLPEHVIHRRTELIRLARASGVETQIGTIHMPLTTFYKSRYCCKAGDFPVTDRVAAAALTLPLYETITEEDQEEAVRVITKLIS